MNNNIKVNNIDGTPFPEAAGSLVSLVDAVEIISSTHVENLLGNREGKKNYKEAESVVHNFLSQARIQANLLTGDYQAGLKLVSPIFFDSEGKLSELPYLNILVALLA